MGVSIQQWRNAIGCNYCNVSSYLTNSRTPSKPASRSRARYFLYTIAVLGVLNILTFLYISKILFTESDASTPLFSTPGLSVSWGVSSSSPLFYTASWLALWPPGPTTSKSQWQPIKLISWPTTSPPPWQVPWSHTQGAHWPTYSSSCSNSHQPCWATTSTSKAICWSPYPLACWSTSTSTTFQRPVSPPALQTVLFWSSSPTIACTKGRQDYPTLWQATWSACPPTASPSPSPQSLQQEAFSTCSPAASSRSQCPPSQSLWQVAWPAYSPSASTSSPCPPTQSLWQAAWSTCPPAATPSSPCPPSHHLWQACPP